MIGVRTHLVREYDELSAHYRAANEQGRDVVSLAEMFVDEYGYLEAGGDKTDFELAWRDFLGLHQHQMIVHPTMAGLVIYLLVNYWDQGEKLYEALPTLEKMLLRDTVQMMSDEINRRSAENGDGLVSSTE